MSNNYFGNSSSALSTTGLTQHEIDQIEKIGSVVISPQTWSYISSINQTLNITSSPSFTKLGINQVAGTKALEVNGTSSLKQGALSSQSNNILTGGDTDFTVSTGNWTVGSNGWSINAGSYIHAANASPVATFALPFTIQTAYRVEIKLTTTTIGDFFVKIGNVSGRSAGKVVGIITDFVDFIITSFDPNPLLTLNPSITWAGSIDYIKIYSLTANDAAIEVITQYGGGSQIQMPSIYSLFIGGSETGKYIPYSSSSIGIGSGSLSYGGTESIAIGNSVLTNNSAAYNVGVGNTALQNNTVGANNTAIGYKALIKNTVGSNNTAIGYSAMSLINEGTSNTAIGYNAGTNITVGIENICLGSSANVRFQATTNAIVIGANSRAHDNCTIVGNNAAKSASGIQNTLLGNTTGFSLTTGTNNTFLGHASGYYSTTGTDNVLIGFDSATAAGNTNNAVAIGSGAIASINSIAIGKGAKCQTASSGLVIGYIAASANMTGGSNTIIGNLSGQSITSAGDIVLLGYGTTLYSSTGGSATVIGALASGNANSVSVGTSTKSYDQGVSIGKSAGGATTTGQNNTLIGFEAGKTITTGYDNTLVGHSTGTTNIGTFNAIAIGKGVVAGNNEIKIGNASHTTAYLNGITSIAAPYTGLCPLFVNPTTGQLYRGAVI